MKALLFIGTGSFIGGLLRYLLAIQIFTRFVSAFPYGTLAVFWAAFLLALYSGMLKKPT